MNDRDKPSYNPEIAGDSNDYWNSASKYHEQKLAQHAASEAKMGSITNKEQWLIALGKALADDDAYIFERLGEIARQWEGSEKEKQHMQEILYRIQDLQSCW